ncbi:MAG TPA: bifunctional oligoribonuclease/PAP phosphatase NrnA [bacterium]|nr:bifunctional oligoribonuclease/PAP phosphatase NrnA [bacterium]
MTQALQSIVDLIGASQDFLITSHVDPDGDAVGCLIAMYSVLKRLGKSVKAVSEDGVPPTYRFLQRADEVLASPVDPAEVAIVVDSGAVERTGWVADIVKRSKTVVNIDHHRSNTFFGHLNLVEKETGACGEIVYRVLSKAGVHFEKSEAEALYVAIMSDTGCFRFPTTTAQTLEIAAHLVALGVRPYHVASEIYWKKSLTSLKILGSALSSIEVMGGGKVAMMGVTRRMHRETGSSDLDTEGFANYPRSIEGVAVGVLLREIDDGLFRISLRAAEGYDVDVIAKLFGGGGHAAAAGCRIEGDLETVKAKLRDAILAQLGNRAESSGS